MAKSTKIDGLTELMDEIALVDEIQQASEPLAEYLYNLPYSEEAVFAWQRFTECQMWAARAAMAEQ